MTADVNIEQLGLDGFHAALSPEQEAAIREHPAQYTPAVLDAIVPILDRWRLPVHDPFAGTGHRLAARCDRLGLMFTGTEIEEPFIADRRVRHGDSTDAAMYPTGSYCVVTSPTYGNGMNDDFNRQDGTIGRTYRNAVKLILGLDRELHPNNTGRYTMRNGSQKKAAPRASASAVFGWRSRCALVRAGMRSPAPFCRRRRARPGRSERWSAYFLAPRYVALLGMGQILGSAYRVLGSSVRTRPRGTYRLSEGAHDD